jgi:hypothetical protein
MRDEVEGGLDNKVREFARQAAQDQVRAVAKYVADPKHADAFSQLRLSILDVLLDTPMSDMAAELDKLGPSNTIAIVANGVRGAIGTEDFVDRVEKRMAKALDEVGDGSLGAWLEEAGLLEVWTDTTTELVAARLKAVVQTEAFEAWWEALHR